MPGSPRKEGGESPQTGAKPGATLRRWSAGAAERMLRRTFVRLEKCEDGEMNSPLQRMGEIHPAKYAGCGGDPQRKRREIPPYAARRANNARKKKPGCSVRNGRAGLGGAGYPGLTAFVALR